MEEGGGGLAGAVKSEECSGSVRVRFATEMHRASQALENLGHDLAIESANIK